MKTKLLSMLLIMAACVCVTSCSDDDDDNDSQVVGTWDGKIVGVLATLDFGNDGNGALTVYNVTENMINPFEYKVLDKNKGTFVIPGLGPSEYMIEGEKMYIRNSDEMLTTKMADDYAGVFTKRAKGNKFAYPMNYLYGKWIVKRISSGGTVWIDATGQYATDITFNKDYTYVASSKIPTLGSGSGTYEVDGFKIITRVEGTLYIIYRVMEMSADGKKATLQGYKEKNATSFLLEAEKE